MKKIYVALCLLSVAASDLCAQRIINRSLPVTAIELSPAGERMTVAMTLDASRLKASKDREFWITPTLVAANGADSVELEPVVISGRNLYYAHLRNDDLDGAEMVRAGKNAVVTYSGSVARKPWVTDATLKLNSRQCGCCSAVLSEYSDPVARVRRVTYEPVFSYVTPLDSGVKEFKLEGSAFVNFPVNRTELYPDYMTNPAELRKITGTIDSVRGDKDITITSIFIKGFASPEGPYDNNVRLAKGRTATLKQYVENLYHFAPGFIRTDFLPEDWPGLKKYVEGSSLANRTAILAIIDSPLEPDAKDAKLKATYPADYDFLLRTVYPSLRHSDYVINYNVRKYTSLEEILAVLRTAPQKLSPEEFYRAAQSMEEGSEEYNEVFETAVRMYPDNKVANLNAANSAMRRGEYARAARYLSKAGAGADVEYSLGVLAALQKDYALAESYFRKAATLGCDKAKAALDEMAEMKRFADGKIELIEN